MKYRTVAYLAAAWAIVFAAPHIYWATGRKDGLGTALSDRVVRDAGTGMAISCAGIALFCLCGAAVAMATVQDWPALRQTLARRTLIVLTWFGAVLLIVRSLDIYVEFNLALTGLEHIPAEQHANFLYLSRWFMFCYGPWFALGAIAWTRLAWLYTRVAAAPAAPHPADALTDPLAGCVERGASSVRAIEIGPTSAAKRQTVRL